MNNLQDVISNLNSDKIKQRQEGLVAVREVFASDRAVNNFAVLRDGKVKPKLWLTVLQAIFGAALKENYAITRKTTGKTSSISTSIRRLSDTASTLRWLIERAVHVFNANVAEACVEHMTQMMYAGRDVFNAVALDYSKALRCIVAYQPHLDHLKKDTWLKIASLSFNVILGDSLKKELVEDEEMEVDDVPSDMYVDDSEEEEEDQLASTSKGKKRSRRRATPLPILSPQKSQSKSRHKRNVTVSVSLEQVEFTSLLRCLVSSPSAPLLSPVEPEDLDDDSTTEDRIPVVILNRLQRFLELYTADSSLLRDYIAVLLAVLDHISLNRIFDVIKFARSTWDALIGLWGTKDKTMKEGLLGVLRHLFPFITCPPISENRLPSFDCGEGLGRLWHLLNNEADSRWGVDGLSLDSIRLEINSAQDVRDPENNFVASTFCAGWNFDAGQALSWAILELQADCAAKLFQLSESMHTGRSDNKRVRLEDPILSLLQSIQSNGNTLTRCYHLQVLLFIIDRHWSILHGALKQDIMSILQQFISIDDISIQSWIFVNLAAVARAERSADKGPPAFNTILWDSVWAHAVRRVNVPGICRAACHAGFSLLSSSSTHASTTQSLITGTRALIEIETLLKDMDVQGPSFPFDSVAAFLSQCLILASQDVRLYRMHLEDKVLSWLMDAWQITNNRTRMPQCTMSDISRLLDTLCGLPKRSLLSKRIPLPRSDIVDRLAEEQKVEVIRDFALFAKLPPFTRSTTLQTRQIPQAQSIALPDNASAQLVAPRGRERKISGFFTRCLESLIAEWELLKDHNPSAERARRSLDFAFSAVVFEAQLVANGVALNSQVVLNAGKVILLITPLLLGERWILDEKLVVAQSFAQLMPETKPLCNHYFREALSRPGEYSGIQEKLLQELVLEDVAEQRAREERLRFLRHIWQHSEVREILNPISVSLRVLLVHLLTGNSTTPENAMDVDEKDGFAPIRTNAPQSKPSDNSAQENDTAFQGLIRVCIGFLACSPFLQSPDNKPTRDPELLELILKSTANPHKFCTACPIFFQFVREKVFHLSLRSQQRFVEQLGDLLRQYSLSKHQLFIRIVLDFLVSTLGVWKVEDEVSKDLHAHLRDLYAWLSTLMGSGNCGSWTLRDGISRLLGQYLLEDPGQVSWATRESFNDHQEYQDALPSSILQRLNHDHDVRVRFRAGILNAGLFAISHHFGQNAGVLYENMKRNYIRTIDNYEHMLTRLIALGNVLVVSSAVRRGAYWNILELCVNPTAHSYTCHIEIVLIGVYQRLGMPSLSGLFESYASQLAYSLRNRDADLFGLPPHLLGYRDRRQCAEATFRSFSPLNLVASGSKSFETHCRIVQKDLADGFRECFGSVIGMHILGQTPDNGTGLPDNMEDHLHSQCHFIPNFSPDFPNHMDAIVTTVMKGVGDQDFSGAGPDSITTTLQSFDPKLVPTFRALTRYRVFDPLRAHQPNLPAFPTSIILQSIHWLSSRWGGFTSETTYHVLHELFNEINSTPLVNEQLRLTNALSIWIAYRQRDVVETTIADTLIHGATFLLSQYNLAQAARSILEWAFTQYTPAKNWVESRLPNMIVRIRCIAQDYAASEHPVTSTLGQDLVKWIDGQMISLAKKASFRFLARRVLPTWPQQPSSAQAKLYDEITMEDLSSILGDHRITSNKFRLVRRLQELASPQDQDDEQFSKVFFWRLKDCIPSSERLQEDDVHAFTSLLSFYGGRIGSLNIEQANLLSPRNRHRRNVTKRSIEDTVPARDAITLGLLVMLDDDDPRRVARAYRTLRHALSASGDDDRSFVIPTEYRQDLEYLKVYKRTTAPPAVVNLQEALHLEVYINTSSNFDAWLPQLSSLLCNSLAESDPYFGQLVPTMSADVAFAEQVLPVLVHSVLLLDRRREPSTRPLRQCISGYFTTILHSTSCDVRCTRSIVDVILHLRHFSVKHDALSYNKWLDIDFSLLARSAILYGAYTTALLFVELAHEHHHSTMDVLATEQVLYEIYAHIDEPDGFYGINTQDLQKFLVKRFHHEKQWDKALRFHGAALEADNTQGQEQVGLLQSFHSFGFDHLAIESLRFFREGSGGVSDSVMNYKLGWRTETWDLPEQSAETNGAALYRSLRAVYRERDPVALQSTIRDALFQEMGHLRALGSENLAEIRLVTQDILCLREILQWRQVFVPRLHCLDQDEEFDWPSLSSIGSGYEFSDLESMTAIRMSLVRSVRQKEERRQIGTMMTPLVRNLLEVEKKCLLDLSRAARASGQVQIALNSVIRAQKLGIPKALEVSEELANVLWLQKEEKPAVQFLQGIVTTITDAGDHTKASLHFALLLSRLGTWTSEACLEKATDIWDRYFSRAIDIVNAPGSTGQDLASTKATIFRECAMFAERQYHAVLKSPDALRWKLYVDRKTNEIEYRNQEITRTQSDAQRRVLQNEQSRAHKLLQEDSELFRNHNHLLESLLRQAIEMHSRCLETSSAFDDDSAIRLCSLWFANFDDESILDAVSDALDRIPSRKFVFLAHQITARLSQQPSAMVPHKQEILQRIVLRMCQEHPFHTLYQVYSISDHLVRSDNRRSSGRISQSTQTERGTAADGLLDRLRDGESTGSRVKAVEKLCDACLEWAKFPILRKPEYKKTKNNPGFNIPDHLKILKIKSSSLQAPVATASIPLDPSMKYENCVWIDHYERTFTTAGGINMPKINICKGTDGQSYKQLFKGEGNDDLRQDAVMEQVFDLVNNLLSRDRETKRRDLGVRGYKIIPLSNQAGLLEFVGNTQPMKDWLVKAHSNYHPKDLRSDEASVKLRDAQSRHPDRHDKQLEAFLEVRKRFRPVLRHYFTEKHRNPLPWFQMRLKYTRSVATTSIVGHVIGLGDRHLSNILMDTVSGEVVHIDLGIAFDQGKLLAVPERVPFRMTADLVDGMGTSGTAGVFQRCAEETLRVLREESGVIMTVLEVFKHDPLHSWTASEIKVKQAQSDVPTTPSVLVNDNSRFNIGIGLDMTSGTADEAADRALSSVARKLGKSLSIESTVNELIAEATDPMNLATLFFGWSPHM